MCPAHSCSEQTRLPQGRRVPRSPGASAPGRARVLAPRALWASVPRPPWKPTPLSQMQTARPPSLPPPAVALGDGSLPEDGLWTPWPIRSFAPHPPLPLCLAMVVPLAAGTVMLPSISKHTLPVRLSSRVTRPGAPTPAALVLGSREARSRRLCSAQLGCVPSRPGPVLGPSSSSPSLPSSRAWLEGTPRPSCFSPGSWGVRRGPAVTRCLLGPLRSPEVGQLWPTGQIAHLFL